MWNDDKVKQLKVLWAEGLSCSQIARVLGDGVTRNAVIGKVTRLRKPAHNQNYRYPKAVRIPAEAPSPPLQEPPALDANGNRYTALTIPYQGKCKYPFDAPHVEGGYIFCAHPVKGEGEPYCAFHHARCRTKTPQLSPRSTTRTTRTFDFARAA